MSRTRFSVVVGLLLATAATTPAPAAAQTTTVGSPTATNLLNGFGVGGVSVIGQSFVLPGGTSFLQSFTLFLGESFNGAGLRFDAGVYELGMSTPLFVAGSGVAGSTNTTGLDAFRFQTTNLMLDPSKQYAFLLTSPIVANGNPDGALNVVGTTEDPNGVTSGDTYAGGTLVGGDDAANLAALDFDAAFQADFTASAVPEPGTFALLAGGLALAGAAARRRKRA